MYDLATCMQSVAWQPKFEGLKSLDEGDSSDLEVARVGRSAHVSCQTMGKEHEMPCMVAAPSRLDIYPIM